MRAITFAISILAVILVLSAVVVFAGNSGSATVTDVNNKASAKNPGTIYVGTGPGNDSATIQGGINLANAGDTIFVWSGTYYENVVIDKTLTLMGEDRNTTIIDGGGSSGYGLRIEADWVNVSGFTTRNCSSDYPSAGIVCESDSNVIANCTITLNHDYAIRIFSQSDNVITNCEIVNNLGGIYLEVSSGSTITNCNISSNSYHGIYLYESSNNKITNCDIFLNSDYGIYLCLSETTNNSIYHNNFINNMNNAYDECTNYWDYNDEGNYWSDYDEASEGAYDDNTDGIVDTPYAIPGGSNVDNYPFMEPSGWEEVGLTPHAPIYINGNSQFTSANGVSSGNGTADNPYIIENWDINASTANGIKIENTDVYFIIRNCTIHDGKSNYKYGVYFHNVTNGKIENGTSENNSYGIYFDRSSNNTITNCTYYDDDYYILSSSDIYVANITIYQVAFFQLYDANRIFFEHLMMEEWNSCLYTTDSTVVITNSKVHDGDFHGNSKANITDTTFVWFLVYDETLVSLEDCNITVDFRIHLYNDLICEINNLTPGTKSFWNLSENSDNIPFEIQLINTTIEGGWSVIVWGSTNLTIRGSDVFWVLYGEGSTGKAEDSNISYLTCMCSALVTLNRTSINHLSCEYYNGTIRLNNTIVEEGFYTTESEFELIGDNISFGESFYIFRWMNSTILRNYDILCLGVNKKPIQNVSLELYAQNGTLVWNGKSDQSGRASFNITFTDANYNEVWTVNATKGIALFRIDITFSSSSPLPIVVFPIHNIDKDTYYDTIQKAIDDANLGDTIEVSNGTYYENVIINKTITLIGEDRNNTIIDGNGTGDVIYLSADWVNVSGFGVRNSGYSYGDAGIEILSSDNNISNCEIFDNWDNVYLSYSSNNVISDCNIHSSRYYCGITAFYTTKNMIMNCDIYSNNNHNIYLYSSSGTKIKNCNLYSSGIQGIWLSKSSNNTISACNVYNNSNNHGILLYHSSKNNTITACNIYDNYEGIRLESSSNNNQICVCNIYNNYYGIYLSSSSNINSLYCNNLVKNTIMQAYDECSNFWDNGTVGNYWSDYNGGDRDGDGIGDTAYDISGKTPPNQDNYPFMNPIEYMPPTIESTSPSNGEVNVTVNTNITIIFSEPINKLSAIGNITMEPFVEIEYYIWSDNNKTLTLILLSNLSSYTNYTVTITMKVKDLSQNSFQEPYQFSFRTKDVTPPIANAGADQWVNEDTLVTFDSSGSTDNVGIMNYTWTFTDGTLQTLYGISLTYTFNMPGTYVVTLNVSDAAGNWDTDIMTVYVNDNTKPDISNVCATPSTTSQGDYVNITCTVSDNVAISIVTINITVPAGSATINNTMTRIGDTNRYYYNLTYSIAGDYSYYIWANDTSSNENKSTEYYFTIMSAVTTTIAGKEVNITGAWTGTINITSVALPQTTPENVDSIGIFIEVNLTGALDYANITIKYNKSDIAGIDESKLKMYYWNENEGKWKICEKTGVDVDNNIVWANVTHLTIFAPMAEKVGVEAAPGLPYVWLLYIAVAIVIVALIAGISLKIVSRKKPKEELKPEAPSPSKEIVEKRYPELITCDYCNQPVVVPKERPQVVRCHICGKKITLK